ncbi:MAG: peptidylprolyl isomerase [Alphaproteobacteria bacterium]
MSYFRDIHKKKDNAKNLSDLVYNLRHDDRFELYAMQFSDSPSAANGGNLGWVNKGKLASPLETALNKMSRGDISEPILVGDGYYILKLQNLRPPKDKPELPDEKQIRAFLENQKMEVLSKKLLQELRQKAVIELRS